MQRRQFLTLAGATALVSSLPLSANAAVGATDVVQTWYRLVLELVRHTATYSPPVAARAFAYMGVAGYEAAAVGTTLAGQLHDLTPVPAREAADYDEALVQHGVLAEAVRTFFGNTGPSGQRAMAAMQEKMEARLRQGVPVDVANRSLDYGTAVAKHIEAWSLNDGGAVVENMGFPMQWTLQQGPEHWVPTSSLVQQQAPLLPDWSKNRTFAMVNGLSCQLIAPPAYSEDPNSQFYKEAMEVYEASQVLTDEQQVIARFWSDDPMLSPTPPGHWVSVTLEILKRDNVDLAHTVDAMARLGIGLADAFIACWQAKFQYDLVRPVTYINRVIDPKWQPSLITPPFPEYPSGHSTQSGAAAAVLTAVFGENFAFEDATHVEDDIPARPFASFWDAAKEAAISRLYGGIHFRSAIDLGLEQGRCVAEFTNALKTLA